MFVTFRLGILKAIAANALRAVRPFLKLSGEQSAAWDVVVALLS